MTKKLRLRFIGVSMSAVFLVLAIMVGIINIINFQKVISDADYSLEKISQMDFEDESKASIGMPISTEANKLREKFFVANFDNDGNLHVNISRTEWLTEDEAKNMANLVSLKKGSKGSIADYRYLKSLDEQTIWFLDIKNETENANNFLKTSLIVSLVGILGVCILVVLFSYVFLKPVEESYKKQKQFITNAAHELKTPLTVISLNNQLLEMQFNKSENTQNISIQVKNMTKMVQNLLTLARLDEQVLKANLTNVNLKEILNSEVVNFEKVLKTNNRSFTNEIKDDVFIKSDEMLLKQMLSIFLDNASKYAQKRTIISGINQNKKFILSIKNDTTLEDGNMEKCFERFFRSDDARASGIEGSGVGLSIAKEISKLISSKVEAYIKDKMFTIEVEFKLFT